LQGEGGFGKAYLQMFHLPLGKAPVGSVEGHCAFGLVDLAKCQVHPTELKKEHI